MVPEVKNVRAGEVVVRFEGVGTWISAGVAVKRAWKFDTPAEGTLPPICMTVFSSGHDFRTLRTLETEVSSPMKQVAEDTWRRYSISLSTRRVVQGHRMIPERRHAVAIDHHSGRRGRIRIHVSPCWTPSFWKM